MSPARLIVADPAWSFRNRHDVRHDGGKTKFGIGVAARYSNSVMQTTDIVALPVASICAPDCYLFLWTTWTHLPDALRVIAAWGFEYKTVAFVWVKLYPSGQPFFGPGRYVPSNSEPMLFAVRGRPWHPNTGAKPLQIVSASHPRGADGKIIHSRKPADVHERIEEWLTPHIGDGSMVEMFATQARQGWTCLGHELSGRLLQDELPELAAQIALFRSLQGVPITCVS